MVGGGNLNAEQEMSLLSRNGRVTADERCQLISDQIRKGPVSALRSEGFGVPFLKATVTHKAGLLEQL